MSNATAASLVGRAADLRSDFDRAFAAPRRPEQPPGEDLLQIQVGGRTCAIRLAEIASLHAGKRITRVPGGGRQLLGIAGFRRSVLPVYDLAALLGEAGSETPRWLVIAATAPVALAFERLEGWLRVSSQALAQSVGPFEPAHAAHRLVRAGDITTPVLRLPSVLAAIGRPAVAPTPTEGP
jgi:purine-binding chemotaxis protein CheW